MEIIPCERFIMAVTINVLVFGYDSPPGARLLGPNDNMFDVKASTAYSERVYERGFEIEHKKFGGIVNMLPKWFAPVA